MIRGRRRGCNYVGMSDEAMQAEFEERVLRYVTGERTELAVKSRVVV